jgi:hypothetical protein
VRTYKLAYPPSHQPKNPSLWQVSNRSGGSRRPGRRLLSSVRKAPRDIFCCSFFLGAMWARGLAIFFIQSWGWQIVSGVVDRKMFARYVPMIAVFSWGHCARALSYALSSEIGQGYNVYPLISMLVVRRPSDQVRGT